MIILTYNSMEKKSFWDTKPVLHNNEIATISCGIEDLSHRKLYNNSEQIALPNIMKWENINIDNQDNNNKICQFLNKHYDSDPRIKFTSQLLELILGLRYVVLGVVRTDNNTLCGIIGCSIHNTVIYDKKKVFANVVLLCAHGKYRKKNMTQTMINELIRYLYVNHNISYGIFSSTKKFFKPISVYSTYIRPINYIKLCDARFIEKVPNSEQIHKNLIVNGTPADNYIPMKESQLNDVYSIYIKFISRFNLYYEYTKEEFFYLLTNKHVKSYVITEDDKIVDFVSYYTVQYEGAVGDINAGHLFLYTSNIECGDLIMQNLLKIIANDVDVLIVNDMGTIGNILLTTKYKNVNEDSDQETYTKIYEHKFLKKKKIYINFFNWKTPYLSSNLISLFSL